MRAEKKAVFEKQAAGIKNGKKWEWSDGRGQSMWRFEEHIENIEQLHDKVWYFFLEDNFVNSGWERS